ncbi:MAG TPA: DUF3596 domain-containing protein [Psychromonas hadalis]|nr:DUF3596 domain-containing protein [Psychromonas hadalis]
MGTINVKSQKLYLDFRAQGNRFREYTKLADTPANRKRLEKMLKMIEVEIMLDQFDYAKYFPNSKRVRQFKELQQRKQTASNLFSSADAPTVKEFSEIWFSEKAIEWRKSYKQSIEGILESHILPAFGKMKISVIKKQDILTFRAALAKVQTRTKKTLSASRINHIMRPLRMMLNEAADRYEFTTPWKNIKALKVPLLFNSEARFAKALLSCVLGICKSEAHDHIPSNLLAFWYCSKVFSQTVKPRYSLAFSASTLLASKAHTVKPCSIKYLLSRPEAQPASKILD